MEMELISYIEEIKKTEKQAKIMLIDKVKTFPENRNIKRINRNCFIISSNVVFSDKEKTLSAEYYDFAYQYKFICDRIKTVRLEGLINMVDKWIKTGYININDNQRLKLHPEVIKNLKTLIQ